MKRIALLFSLGMLGCTGTETGNPSFDGSLGYDAYSSEPKRVALVRSEDVETVVESAWIVLGDTQFRSGSDCKASRKPDGPSVAGIGAGDHAGSQAPASEFELSAGSFCGVQVLLVPARGVEELGGAPPELQDHALVLQGSRPDGQTFRISSARRYELFLRADEAFELDEEHPSVLLGFDVARWIDELEWDRVEPSEGLLAIDIDHNAELLEEFEDRVASGVALFRDDDGDGLLDPESRPIARAE